MAPAQTDMLQRAVARLRAGDVQQAEGLCRAALAADRRNHQAAALLGQIATMTGRNQEALKLLERCVSQAPSEADYHVLLAEALVTAGRSEDALARYDRVLKLRAGYPPAVAGQANTLIRLGQAARAREVLERYVAAGTEDAGMAVVYARLAIRDRDLDRAVEIASRHAGDIAPNEVLRSLWNEIGRAHEQAGRYDESFAAYGRCNQIAPPPWDPAEASARHDVMMEVFSAEALRRLARSRTRTDVPVFIVGQPRSGSTLIEQIIAAHPQAHGAGEVQHLAEIVASMPLRIGSTLAYPECVADLDAADAEALGQAYLGRLRAGVPPARARRICDKQLANYEYLGTIALLLPGARVIHSRRDPLDTCLSCYSQKFAPGAPGYTRDLRHLGMLYNDYLALMAHWRAALDLPMLEVDYEALVADQESMSRKIIEFCGLPWNEKCLRFHESERPVLTLSRDQVNRPIYRTSLRRAQRFEKHLLPLRAILESGERASSSV